ncbi:MAG: hypothetical protein KDM91_20840 [Verrucomicrobiae bacterium]|nr:hypothetical protein [Verrucomicrobiae bacterium]
MTPTEAPPTKTEPLVWEADTPIFRNKFVMGGMLAAVGIATLFLALVTTAMMVSRHRYEGIPGVLAFSAAIGGGVWLLLMGVSLVFFRGGMRTRVVVDGERVTQTVVSRRADRGGLAAVLVGAASGSPGTAGAGLIAAATRSESARFSDLQAVEVRPERGEIRLRNDWRTVMQLFAPPERFGEIVERLRLLVAARAEPVKRADLPPLIKLPVIMGALVFGGFLLVEFPLGFDARRVLPMVALTLLAILGRPAWRRWLGWLLAAGIAGAVFHLWRIEPPSPGRERIGWALGVQLGVIGLFAAFGLAAGLGFFNPKKTLK